MTASSIDVTQPDKSQIFACMIALIQDEIDDTTGEYYIQIQDSILTALRLCKRENFFFTDKMATTFKTQSGKTWYGQEVGLFIDTEKNIMSMFWGTNPATQRQLFYETPKILKKKYGANPPLGIPLFYTCVDQKIGLFPAPKMNNTVQLFYAPVRFGEEKCMLEDDPWMLYAFDLIKARAKYELYKNILKDPEYAAFSFNDFQEQLKILHIETSSRKNASKIIPMRF
ncbi:hypothetical protein [Bartonella sp. B30(2025)]